MYLRIIKLNRIVDIHILQVERQYGLLTCLNGQGRIQKFLMKAVLPIQILKEARLNVSAPGIKMLIKCHNDGLIYMRKVV